MAIAGELARRSHALTLVARRADRLSELAEKIGGEHGVDVEWISADITDAADRDRIATEIAGRDQVVDVLVNNAGMGTVGLFHELPVEKELDMIRLNVEAMVALCGAFVPGMVERGSGRILNVASVSGFMPVPKQATYAASKAFVLTFTESLTFDLHGTGVTATALCPGPVKTDFEGIIEGLPDRLYVEPERVAREAIDGLEARRPDGDPGWQQQDERGLRPARPACGVHGLRATLLAVLSGVLILGATGQVGNAIARRLAADGGEVRALVRSPERAKGVLPDGVEAVKGDVADAKSLQAAFEGISTVYHSAGIPEQWRKDVGEFERVNVDGTRNVVEAALAAGVERFVYTSTDDVLVQGPGQEFDESVINPGPGATPYQRSKLEADRIVTLALDRGLPAVFLHPAGVYGPAPFLVKGLNDLLLELAKRKTPMLLPGGMGVAFSEDVADGHIRAADAGRGRLPLHPRGVLPAADGHRTGGGRRRAAREGAAGHAHGRRPGRLDRGRAGGGADQQAAADRQERAAVPRARRAPLRSARPCRTGLGADAVQPASSRRWSTSAGRAGSSAAARTSRIVVR